MPTPRLDALVRAALAATLIIATPIASAAQQDVVVTNNTSAAVPVVPGLAAGQVQHTLSTQIGVPWSMGPFNPGTQLAITSLTFTRQFLGFPSPSTKVHVDTTLAVSPRVGPVTCDPNAVSGDRVTLVRVPETISVHIAYPQPLLAPPTLPDTPWCLRVMAVTGPEVVVTLSGYVK